MKQHTKYNGLKAVEEQSKRFFTGGEFQWKKSRTAVWEEIEPLLKQHKTPVVTLNFTAIKWAVAAVIIILLGIGSLMRFYTSHYETNAGEHLSMALPDGSTVDLNAKSAISYHPYWWKFDRKVVFEGEGFFSVQKGKRFRVVSNTATTEVLGTRFNIFSRENTYKVVCIEGSVKVVSNTGNKVILKKNDKATVREEGTILTMNNIEPLPEISWKEYSFFFTSVPVSDVFSEIERQYNITIKAKVNLNSLYTGNFSKNQNVEEVLGYICPAMGFRFVRDSRTSYSIIPNDK